MARVHSFLGKLLISIVILVFSASVHAEYYLVYPPASVACVTCGKVNYYKKISHKHKRVYCTTCGYPPPVIFSGMPTNYADTEEVNDFNISYDLRTADDDVYRDPGMNYGY